MQQTGGPSAGFLGVGQYTITYTGTLGTRNTSCSFSVAVEDPVPPQVDKCLCVLLGPPARSLHPFHKVFS